MRGVLSLVLDNLILVQPLQSTAAVALVIAIWGRVDGTTGHSACGRPLLRGCSEAAQLDASTQALFGTREVKDRRVKDTDEVAPRRAIA